jgi:hypothetical protein
METDVDVAAADTTGGLGCAVCFPAEPYNRFIAMSAVESHGATTHATLESANQPTH